MMWFDSKVAWSAAMSGLLARMCYVPMPGELTVIGIVALLPAIGRLATKSASRLANYESHFLAGRTDSGRKPQADLLAVATVRANIAKELLEPGLLQINAWSDYQMFFSAGTLARLSFDPGPFCLCLRTRFLRLNLGNSL